MKTIAVTGGIGAGKSTVSRQLAALGAIVIDSDHLARAAVAPGTEGLRAIRQEFGPGVLSDEGSLDRGALAAIVFDPDTGDEARSRLEGITHPLVRAEFRRRRDQAFAQDPHAVVVNDIPLLRTAEQAQEFDLVVVVVADEQHRIARLLERGLTEEDARARIAAQITDAERSSLADVVISNNGDEADLAARVRELWEEWLSE